MPVRMSSTAFWTPSSLIPYAIDKSGSELRKGELQMQLRKNQLPSFQNISPSVILNTPHQHCLGGGVLNGNEGVR